MVNTEDFGKRIQKLMEYYSISASGFADAMGVGRSSISHILSGRNKPSLDFVLKITEAYPEVELYWLLYGQGFFPKSEITPKKNESTTPIPIPTIPLEEDKTEQDLFSQPERNNNIQKENIDDSDNIKDIPIKSVYTEKEVHQIVIFYKDGTFDFYKN